MITNVIQINREKTIFWTLVGVLAISIAFYMYCINVTVHNTVARQNLELEASKLSLKIGNEEFQYISKRNSVTIALAHELGYKDAQPQEYIPRTPETKVAFASN